MERRPPVPHSRPLPRPPMKKQNPSSSKEMDEVDAMINQFASGPRFYDGTRMKSQISTITAPKVKTYEPIDWKLAFPQSFILGGKIPVYINGEGGPTILCLHGAGHSGLSFAPLALLNITHRIISFDFRGHGLNKMSDSDLSTESLIGDTIEVLQWIEKSYGDDNIILIGHSMGGSIATKTCDKIFTEKDKYKALYEKIQGLIVIDVVEGTAIDALPFMENIVNNRPVSFPSLEKAIQYMNKSGTIRNLDSARISVPPLLKEEKKDDKVSYSWVTNLMASEKYWTDWFNGLTKAFLKVQVPKILMLAGAERMDKELTIAQMQGKFMLSIVRGTGHVIHEDNPKKVMDIIEDFLETFHIKAKLSEMTPVIGRLGNYTPTMIKYDKTQK